MMVCLCACSESTVAPTSPSPLPEHKIGQLELSCPATVQAQSLDGRPLAIDFTPAATGGLDPVTVACTPASGSRFPVGETQVSCVATDALQQSSRCRFAIMVLAPPMLAISRFLAFGDSITAGVVSHPGGGWTLDRMRSYPAVLRRDLSANYRAQNIQIVNAGAPGEWAANAIPRFREQLRILRPQCVLLMEGTNDVDQIGGARALEQMIHAASAAGADTLLMTIPPQRGLEKAHLVPVINEEIRAIAARRRVVLVDVYRLLLHGACVGSGPIPCIGPDGLHPTAEGYELIAEELARAIVDLYDVEVSPSATSYSLSAEPALPTAPRLLFPAPPAARSLGSYAMR